jgi:hypothetical protein
MNEEEFQEFRGNLGRPIAGQSLTNDPDNPAPFEQAPEFTELDSASLYLWTTITEPEVYAPAMEVLSDGTPIMDLVRLVLKTEFQKGMFNPDLMLLLIEPLAYMFLALAERLDIDPVFYRGQEEDDEKEERILGVTFEEEKLEQMKEAAKSGKVPAGIITSEMKAKLSKLPEVDLDNELEPVQRQQPSLMAAPQEGI